MGGCLSTDQFITNHDIGQSSRMITPVLKLAWCSRGTNLIQVCDLNKRRAYKPFQGARPAVAPGI